MGVIYEIRCIVTDSCYIGASVRDVEDRWREHRYSLRYGDHHSPILQNAWNKYGESSFAFSILEDKIDESELLRREQFHLDTYRPTLNCLTTAGNGLQQVEVRVRMSDAGRSRLPHSAESNRKRSEKRLGKTFDEIFGAVRAEEIRTKISQSHQGRHPSEETRKNMSRSHIGKSPSELTRQRQAESRKLIVRTPEWNRHISEGNKGKRKVISEETRQRLANLRKGMVPTVESNRKRSETLTGRPWSQARRDAYLRSIVHTGESI